MNDINIPQILWEDYVQFRDRITVLALANQRHSKEFKELWVKIKEIEKEYDREYLETRYEDSLSPKE